eukprot:jgi/Ulvmu1/2615/UM014_0066.1
MSAGVIKVRIYQARKCTQNVGRRTASLRAESRGRMGFGPKAEFTQKEALDVQLHSLQVNNTPYADHGVEVMYRFAKFDPFERSQYFGRNLDLGQFERFKRVFFTPHFSPMLGHAQATLLSELPISTTKWRGRILVLHGIQDKEQAVYDITMVKDKDGVHKDMWMTSSLVRDGAEDIPSYL